MNKLVGIVVGIALCLAPLALLVMFFAYAMRAEATGNTLSLPRAVACITGPNPAVDVEVTTDRRGTVGERNILGCTVYWYDGPPGD